MSCRHEKLSSLEENHSDGGDLRHLLAETYDHECRIRDAFAGRLGDLRPHERLVCIEPTFVQSALRADMKTVDVTGILRIWEFKISADHRSLGQILTYLAMERASSPGRKVRAVLAAFDFRDEIQEANEILNLCIEMVLIPPKLRLSGAVPTTVPAKDAPFIPILPEPGRSSAPN